MFGKNLMDKFMNGNVLFALVAILTVLIGFFILRHIGNKRYENYNKDLNDIINSVKSSPNLFFLNRVKNMISHDQDLAERYENLKEKYEEIQAFLKDEVEPNMVEFDQSTYYKKLNDSRKQYKEVKPLVDKLASESTALENELSKIIEIDSQQRNFNIDLQQKYTELMQNYESIKYKVDEMVPALGPQIEALEDKFKELNILFNDQNYKDCKDLGEKINTQVDFLAMNVRDLPTYISIVETVVPEQIEALEKRKDGMNELGFSLETLNVSNRIYAIKELVKFIRADIKDLKIELVGENIEKLNTSIKELNADLDEENAAKGNYADNCKKIFHMVFKANENYQYAVENYKVLEKRYIITDQRMNMEAKLPTLEIINNDLDAVKEIIATKNFAYRDVMKSLNEISERTEEFEKEIEYFIKQRDAMRMKETRAKEEVAQINIILLKVKSEIKNAHLPSISDDYVNLIQESYLRAAEIQELRKNFPIDLEILSTKTDEAITIINKLYKNVHNLIVTAQMVEETIVYGNRYRSDIIEVGDTMTKVELLFRNGQYVDALNLGMDLIYKIDPEYIEKITNQTKKSNPTA